MHSVDQLLTLTQIRNEITKNAPLIIVHHMKKARMLTISIMFLLFPACIEHNNTCDKTIKHDSGREIRKAISYMVNISRVPMAQVKHRFYDAIMLISIIFFRPSVRLVFSDGLLFFMGGCPYYSLTTSTESGIAIINLSSTVFRGAGHRNDELVLRGLIKASFKYFSELFQKNCNIF